MLTIQEQIAEAHRLGKERGRHRAAAKLLLAVARDPQSSPAERLEAYHQSGVYALNNGEPDYALRCFTEAAWLAETDLQRGNILRDESRAYLAKRKFSSALIALKEALHCHKDYPLETALDRGFLGRIHFVAGHGDLALSHLGWANGYLQNQSGDDARRLELYNKLHLAAALAKYREPIAERVAMEARGLAHYHGNWQHRLRAFCLVHLGWRGERLFQTAMRGLKLASQLAATGRHYHPVVPPPK